MLKRAIIIQARNNSSRFPKKMISDIDGKGTAVFAFLLQRLLSLVNTEQLFLATTTKPEDDVLCDIATRYEIGVFRGNEHNVLSRFIDCASTYHIDEIVRLCADNPFVYLSDLKTLMNITLDSDYISFCINDKPSITTHYGFWAELVSKTALQKAAQTTQDRLYIEHVTNYLYQNTDKFDIRLIESNMPKAYLGKDIRLTLDTEIDLQYIKFIIQTLDKSPEAITIKDIYSIIDKYPALRKEMLVQIKQNTK